MALAAAPLAFSGLLGSAVLSAPAGPDLELGRYLASQCSSCHRPDVKAAPDGSAIPNIVGMAEERLAALIKAYRDKKLDNPVMQAATAGLNDEDVAALAAYFARTKAP